MSYGQKGLSNCVTSNMISWEFVTVISAFCNFYIFYMRLHTTPLFSVSFSDEHRAVNDEHRATKKTLKFLVHLEKTLSQAFEMLKQVYGDNIMSQTCF